MDQAEMAYISLTDSALRITTFRNADLYQASMRKSDMSFSTLRGADMTGADLKDVQFTKDEELNEAQSLKGATMPGGSIHP